ncbi:hypothetical protein [Acinetobacter baumannii]|uniref:hypothetical protein n=1 Tax=Acinetobacter baumannii TaxID=470 RepID=UPI00321B3D0A
MKIKFIAYNPDTRTLLRLKEHSSYEQNGQITTHLSDANNNFVFNPHLKKIFEPKDYISNMIIEINNKKFYLISEY